MADDDILSRYYGDQPADYGPEGDRNSNGYLLQGPTPALSTADVRRLYKEPGPLSKALQGTASALDAFAEGPEGVPNKAHLVPFLARSAAQGARAMDNWTRGEPGVQDMLTPTGLAGLGSMPAMMRGAAAHALERPPMPAPHYWREQADALGARAAERAGAMDTEVPAQAAYMFGDKTFTGPHHFAAQDKAYAALGDEVADALAASGKVRDGFITNKIDPETGMGRFISRDQASRMLEGKPGSGYTSEEAWSKLLADNPRASVPGAVVGGLEQAHPLREAYANPVGEDSLMQRLANVPKPPMREVLPMDMPVNRSKSLDGNTEVWSVYSPDGRGGLTASVRPQEGVLRIHEASIPKKHAGLGIGMGMYQSLIDEGFKKGYKAIHSDVSVSPDAQNVYAALKRRGYIVEQSPAAKEGYPAGTLITKDGGDPVFTVRPPEYVSPTIADIMRRALGGPV